MKTSFNTFILLFSFLSIFFQNNASAQSNYSRTVTQKEGRFISGRIDAGGFSIKSKDISGLVEEIHINIELWTLMGEPVEKYLFRWKRGSSVQASDYTTLDKSTLSKYPDLLKRYEALKPEYVELKYFVSTDLKPEYVSQNNLDVCGEKFINNLKITKNSSWGSNGGAGGYRNINSSAHFLISKEGETGNDLVPGSPKDWLSFIQWRDCSGNTNKKSYNTFKYAAKMTFYNLELTELKIPTREIDAIAKEYLKRENVEETDEKKQEEEEEGTKEDNANNWDIAGNEKSDDSWDNSKNNNKEKSNWEKEEKSKSDWDRPSNTTSSKDNFVIKKNSQDQQGVYDKTKKIMVIPFGDYHIYEYKHETQIAKIGKLIDKKTEYTNGTCWDVNIEVYAYLWKRGYVDKSLSWIVEPEKIVTFGYFTYKANNDWQRARLCDKKSPDYRQCVSRREERVKEEKKRCNREVLKPKILSLISYYESQGYTSVYDLTKLNY